MCIRSFHDKISLVSAIQYCAQFICKLKSVQVHIYSLVFQEIQYGLPPLIQSPAEKISASKGGGALELVAKVPGRGSLELVGKVPG